MRPFSPSTPRPLITAPPKLHMDGRRIEPEDFDLIVMGTGLVEAVLAGHAAHRRCLIADEIGVTNHAPPQGCCARREVCTAPRPCSAVWFAGKAENVVHVFAGTCVRFSCFFPYLSYVLSGPAWDLERWRRTCWRAKPRSLNRRTRLCRARYLCVLARKVSRADLAQ